ncbi:hypothetical protein BY996DRAFT_6454308 [Phakopsora pachyrhizi]|nr:hypothetical protein BY996DRAFT_6454308 [Phakopsora pachyrhizi]
MEEKPEIKLESKIDLQIKGGGVGSFAGLGPRQVEVRVGLAGLGSALLGWVLGRAAGAWLCFAGLGPRQAGRAGAAGAWLCFAGLGPGQVVVRGGPAGWAGQVVSGWAGWAGGAAQEFGREIIKDSTLNTAPILALLDDTALPGAKAEALDVESDGCCDDDNQIRPVQLLLRSAPYNEGSGHWARTNGGGAADRLWEEIDQTLRVPEKLMLSGLKQDSCPMEENHNGEAQMKDGREQGPKELASPSATLVSQMVLGAIPGWRVSDAAVDVVMRGFEIRGELFLWIRGFEDDLWNDQRSGACNEDESPERVGWERGNDGEGSVLWRAAGSWTRWAVKGRLAGKGRAGLGSAGYLPGRAGWGRLGVGRGSQGLAWLCWAGSWAGGQAGLLTSEQMRPLASNI